MKDKTHCDDCGAAFPVHPPGHCGGTGYATLKGGKRICYPCADKRQVEELKDRSKPFVGYMDKGIITTWTGGLLMRITQSWPCRLARWSDWHGAKIQAVRATDVHGGKWYGRGSNGVAIALRPCKS